MSDTVRMKHHAIAIPQLTPADRILEASKQLKDAIQQQPQQAPMDEIKAIELLREVLLGENKAELPLNSVQKERAAQKKMPAEAPKQLTTQSGAVATCAGCCENIILTHPAGCILKPLARCNVDKVLFEWECSVTLRLF